jgi:hypothetical protein
MFDVDGQVVCKNCGPLPVSCFYKHSNGGYQSLCKQCKRTYNSQNYKKNKGLIVLRVMKRNELNRKLIRANIVDYLATHPCVKCGEKDMVVLDFHHIVPSQKRMPVSIMVSRSFSWGTVLKEIKKCEVLCANCHRRFHYGSRPEALPGCATL